jgi:hypothetical protein
MFLKKIIAKTRNGRRSSAIPANKDPLVRDPVLGEE